MLPCSLCSYFSSPAILLFFPAVPSFRINNYDLLSSYWIKLTVLILAAGLNMHWRSSPMFVALLQFQNKDTVSSQKYAPPSPLSTLFCGKSEEGVFTQIFNLSNACALSLHSSKIYIQSTIMMTAVAFRLEERQLCWMFTTGNQLPLLTQEASKQLASSVITGNDPTYACIISASN